MLFGALAGIIQVSILHRKGNLRATRDIDLAICVASWDMYKATFQRLVQDLNFTETSIRHRLMKNDTLLDLIPFGNLESPDGHISWPGNEGVVMRVAGFQSVYETATVCKLDTGDIFRVPSLPALIFLKISAWLERKEPRDAYDLASLLAPSFDILQDEIFKHHLDLLDDRATDTEAIGCRASGRMIRKILYNEAQCVDLMEQTLQKLLPPGSRNLIFAMASNKPDVEQAMGKYSVWINQLLSGLKDPPKF